MAVMRSSTACFPSANNISVLSAAKSGLGMPAKPGERLRLTTTTVRDLSTSSIGIPAIGLDGSVRATGFTISLAPITSVTSVCSNDGLMESISRSLS